MSKHLSITAAAESTRRALRTALQVAATAVALVAAVAIPPVADAVNALFGAIGLGVTVTPGVVTAVGALAVVVAAVIAKAQNLLEGRDKLATPEQVASQLVEAAHLLDALKAALRDVKSAASEPAAAPSLVVGTEPRIG